MAKAKKKSSKKVAIPKHPALPPAKEIGELCAEIYRHAIKVTRQQDADEQTVEQVALGEIKAFMTACIQQSKADWKAYTKATGVHAAYVPVKKSAKKKAAKQVKAKKQAKAKTAA